jgi:SAM-dependent methyltransferase
MFLDLIVAAQFRQFHREIDDALLDRVAFDAGCESRIGRMSLLDDAMLAALVETFGLREDSKLLDIGCGRGFLARWLRVHGYAARVTGVDNAPEALEAARRLAPEAEFIEGGYRDLKRTSEFDAVAAIDVVYSGVVDPALVAVIRRSLRSGGRFALTAVCMNGKHADQQKTMRALFAPHFSAYELTDASSPALEFTRRLYCSLMRTEGWTPLIRRRLHEQGRNVLAAIERGNFRYTIATGHA